ncbi:hypothetical protein DPMN_066999 [Dreissena polymorpha]|uniref:Uncharacterized protein n=1 Tax=Dreissena polymorpha TaxID=45954 RepID=A0A9D3YXA5_DREPO|nr:hypothetical protein DPMN_066999 [Dreissena polymorpha]
MEAAMIKLETIRVHFARVLNADKASSDELRSLDNMSNNARSIDDRRSPLNTAIVARRLFAGTTINRRPSASRDDSTYGKPDQASQESNPRGEGRRKTTTGEAWYGLGLGFGLVLWVGLGFGLA